MRVSFSPLTEPDGGDSLNKKNDFLDESRCSEIYSACSSFTVSSDRRK